MAVSHNTPAFQTEARTEPPVVRVSAIVSALSFALDLTEGQPMGHSVRSCVLGMRIAHRIGLTTTERADLYYALLLKDAGCSSNATRLHQILGTDEIKAKRDVKLTDWARLGRESLEYALDHVRTGRPFLERVQALLNVAIHQKRQSREMVQIRCERGAAIARRMGMPERTASAIHSLDEHWNGRGYPDGLCGDGIPQFSRIMNLAQTLEVFHRERGAEAALEVVRRRSSRWFDPDLVRAALSLAKQNRLWVDLDRANSDVMDLEPLEQTMVANERTLDNICLAFADVIDAKSPFTYRHSTGVAAAAVAIASILGMTGAEITLIRRAALLHDIGKLSVPNSILEKPGKLTAGEWDSVRRHPYYTLEILKRIPGFGNLSEIAASHHEKLDGSGYFRHLGAEQMSLPARILVVADIYDALSAKRPYRDAMPLESVFGLMQKDAPKALDATCLDALKQSKDSPDLVSLSRNIEATG